MGAKALSLHSFLLLSIIVIPIFIIDFFWKLKLRKKLFIAIIRMFIQLYFVGFYLQYLFDLNNWIINILYLFVMIFIASFTIIKSVDIHKKNNNIFYIFLGISLPTSLILIFFNHFVVKIDRIFSAEYLIPIGGMLLGNSLRANIIAISLFSKSLKENKKNYQTLIMLGESRFGSIKNVFKDAIKSGLEPTIASISTIGLVSLPGMMTGQILGGAEPITAIQYQISIMIAILCTIAYSIIINLFFVYKNSFDDMDRLNY